MEEKVRILSLNELQSESLITVDGNVKVENGGIVVTKKTAKMMVDNVNWKYEVEEEIEEVIAGIEEVEEVEEEEIEEEKEVEEEIEEEDMSKEELEQLIKNIPKMKKDDVLSIAEELNIPNYEGLALAKLKSVIIRELKKQ